MRLICRIVLFVVAFALAALPAVAQWREGELPALERALRAEPKIAATFGDGTSSFRFEADGQVVEIERVRDLEPEWILDKEGRYVLKTSWVGGHSVNGLIREHSVVSTTVGDITWTTIMGARGVTVVRPDGRATFGDYDEMRCGVETSHAHEMAVIETDIEAVMAEAKRRKPTWKPGTPLEVTDGVCYTPQTETYWGGAEATRARLLNLQDLQNVVFENSGLDGLTVRFIGFYRDVAWREGNPKYDINYFARTKVYKNLRKKWKADLMTMFATMMPDGYSRAQLGGPYKLVRTNTADTTTYFHELGHNLSVPHSTAYLHCGTNLDDSFVTIVGGGYTDPPAGFTSGMLCVAEVILQYSNKDPNVTYTSPYTGETFPTGDAAHNDAGIITVNAPKVANWK